jgi:hypothetical protein
MHVTVLLSRGILMTSSVDDVVYVEGPIGAFDLEAKKLYGYLKAFNCLRDGAFGHC